MTDLKKRERKNDRTLKWKGRVSGATADRVTRNAQEKEQGLVPARVLRAQNEHWGETRLGLSAPEQCCAAHGAAPASPGLFAARREEGALFKLVAHERRLGVRCGGLLWVIIAQSSDQC